MQVFEFIRIRCTSTEVRFIFLRLTSRYTEIIVTIIARFLLSPIGIDKLLPANWPSRNPDRPEGRVAVEKSAGSVRRLIASIQTALETGERENSPGWFLPGLGNYPKTH